MSQPIREDLVPFHGGLAEPVDWIVPLNQRAAFLAEGEALPSLTVNAADLSSVYRLSDGALSPLEGPMREAVWNRVLDDAVIESGGKLYAWTIPLALPLTDAEAGAVSVGDSVAVRDESGGIVAIVDDIETYAWDKARYVASVYGTDRFDHPGGRMLEGDPRSKLLGGKIRVLPQPMNPEYGEYMLSPRRVRALIRDRKWERALAFQTRNPLHRAHEYALVSGVEQLTGQGYFTGAVLNPLVGELKGDDVPAAMRMRCYRELHDRRLLGQGDKDEAVWAKAGYDISEIFELIGLDIKMFYGGPKEAVMHGIYRQNYGFSDIVIGRKHADAPFEDGSPIWGDFDAHEIFDELAGELHIQPCKIGFAAYYETLGRVDLTDRHPDEKPFSISGTKVREQLKAGERPDRRIMRPETSDILIDAYRTA
ncbi:MAG: sulfate adenylyltransferase [Deltaproteobacteria bacterium]|nr:sulfate adenylyltransferase [Deltaproteobacteria bacterium]MBW2383316.1 sulfate adenylyltransferase [Deltaproteobacteria bacterium]MBW2698565.1 sulfate adenylyltransferase [Deltaproteobacteria bacterium]